MTQYKYIVLSLIVFFCVGNVLAQSDGSEVYSNFERNYNTLLQSYYIKTNEKLHHRSYSGTTYGNHLAKETSDEEYQRRLKQLPSPVPLVYNSIVKNHIVYYIDRIGDRVGVMLGLSKYYFPIFENILDSYGVPSELKYLVVIESAFNPKAVSKAGATGLWQFMYSTGRIYDLKVNSIIDDRQDVIKSTVAAAKYLKDLYSIYHDWSLVLAAYNCGPGNVNKAMKRSGKKDFWDIYSFLPKETRNYVPAFIAATYAMNYADKHRIYPQELSRPLDLINDTVIVSKDIYFGQIEKVMGISVEQLESMNPQYKMSYIPGSLGNYALRLPFSEVERFIELEDSISKTDKGRYNPYNLTQGGSLETIQSDDGTTQTVYVTKTFTHKCRTNDSWSSIAKRYGVSVSDLRSWNKKIKTSRLRKGTILNIKQRVAVEKKKYIPQDTQEKESIVQEAITSAENENNQVEKITPKTNEKSTATQQYSNHKNKKNINTSTITHTVKAGETISKIAIKYKVSENQILKANGLNQQTARKIRPGQKLKIK